MLERSVYLDGDLCAGGSRDDQLRAGGKRQRKLLHEPGGDESRGDSVLPNVRVRRYGDVCRPRDGERVSPGQVPGHRGPVPAIRGSVESRVPSGDRFRRPHALERRERAREQRDRRPELRGGVGRDVEQHDRHRPHGRKPHVAMFTLRVVDAVGHGRAGEPADRLRDLVRGLRLLHLGRRLLPSEAEWEYAAAGGNQQLLYPWGSTDPGTNNEYAIYSCNYSRAGGCNIAPVGYASLGLGNWRQLDLAGEVYEWTLDAYAEYVDPCVDCAYFRPWF